MIYLQRLVAFGIALLVMATLSGCAGLLPKDTNDAGGAFVTYQEAHVAFERIEPYQTKTSDLKEIGFDTESLSNVKLIPYPDLVSRLAPNDTIATKDMDRGIRDCIDARMDCRVYEFHFSRETRKRNGNFWLDFFEFSRTTAVTGWRFDSLLAIRDGLVLFRNFGGEPRNDRVERQVKPLGPLQNSGSSVAGQYVK